MTLLVAGVSGQAACMVADSFATGGTLGVRERAHTNRGPGTRRPSTRACSRQEGSLPRSANGRLWSDAIYAAFCGISHH
jgi:hypothetical protein